MMTASLCIIALNEEKFLPGLLCDLENQSYPHELIEIILVDSVSSDNTKKIMESFQGKATDFRCVKVADNIKRVQASGWNIAIQVSEGDVIFRIDAHAHIPADFVSVNMELQEKGEFITGGTRPCLSQKTSPWNIVLLETENSMFGGSLSISKRNRNTRRSYVKTGMYHAAYRREVFEKVGRFNENLLRTEDNEMNYRIGRAGYKFCCDPRIISYQYARSGLKQMLRQKYGNGYWIGKTLWVCPGCISWYSLIPSLFVIGILIVFVFACMGIWQPGAVMLCAYLLFASAAMAVSIINRKANLLTLLMPVIFLALHISYGIGTIFGVLSPKIKKT